MKDHHEWKINVVLVWLLTFTYYVWQWQLAWLSLDTYHLCMDPMHSSAEIEDGLFPGIVKVDTDGYQIASKLDSY